MLLAVTLVVLSCALAALVFMLVRRLAPPGGHLHKIDAASGILGVVGTGFAVILAFVIFTAFDSYLSARRSIGVEAVAMRQLAQTADYFPVRERDQAHADLICYGRAVVREEWRTMQTSDESPVVDVWVTRLDDLGERLPLASEKESAALTNWLTLSEQRQEGRRDRLAQAAPFVPPFMWVLLIGLLVVVVGYPCLFADPRLPLWSQLAGIVALAATMASGLVLVWSLDRPFTNRGAELPPTRITAVVQALETSYSGLTLPCGPTGHPVTR